jgi:hypothetical protein
VAVVLLLDQSNFSCARPLGRFFLRELHALTLSQKLEDGSSNGAPMEEVLDPTLIADEPEPFVDEETRDGPGRHTRVLRSTNP